MFSLNLRVRVRRLSLATGEAAMAARPATAAQKAQRELEDLQLVMRARNGDGAALDVLIRRYTGFVRLKASSYFLADGDTLQARTAEHVYLLQPYARRPGAGQRVHARRRAARPDRRRPLHLRDLDRGAAEPRLHARHGPVAARVGCAPALPRRLVLRRDGGGARLRHEDDRQCSPTREAQGARAPAVSSSPALGPKLSRC